jgi:hypothetical protein
MNDDRIPTRFWFVSAIALAALFFFPALTLCQNSAKHLCRAAEVPAGQIPATRAGDRHMEEAIQRLIHDLDISGRVLANPGTPSARVSPPTSIALGLAPLLRFRAFDREARYRLGKLDLVIDDAGH